MKAEEIRKHYKGLMSDASKGQTVEAQLGAVQAIQGGILCEIAAQVAEANEYLKRFANPPIAFNVDHDAVNLSGSEFLPGRITFTELRATLCDQFAIAALTAIIGRGDLDTEMNVSPYCRDAYTIADAMVEARKR
jgi:hypothetical protein